MKTDPEIALNSRERKPLRSKLDPYAQQLLKMHDKHDNLPKMQKWLLREGLAKIDPSTISRFLKRLRVPRGEAQILSFIARGCKQWKQVEAYLRKNPPPDLQILIHITQSLIWNIYTSKKPDNAKLSLADRLVKTAMRYADDQVRNAFKEREVKIAEDKAVQSRKFEQALALQFCLEECQDCPEAQELFKSAFNALDAPQPTSP